MNSSSTSVNPYKESRPEAFPRTRMMPSGWNFMDVPKKKTTPVAPVHDPELMAFPEPMTMPEGWDLSDLIK